MLACKLSLYPFCVGYTRDLFFDVPAGCLTLIFQRVIEVYISAWHGCDGANKSDQQETDGTRLVEQNTDTVDWNCIYVKLTKEMLDSLTDQMRFLDVPLPVGF